MKCFEPLPVTDARLTAASVPEDDHAEWDAATPYSAGDRVIILSTHSIYESVQDSNLNVNPVTDTDGANWLRVSATNRWKAFDGNINFPVDYTNQISYSVETDRLIDGVALFGVSAKSVQVIVEDAGAVEQYSETKTLADTTGIIDWFAFYTFEPVFEDTILFTGIPGYTGHTIKVLVGASGSAAKVSEIVLGRVRSLGVTLAGTEIGFEDFSTKERDPVFGTVSIVQRQYADTALFNFAVPVGDSRRVKGIVGRLRATPTVWYAEENLDGVGDIIFGFLADSLRIPLSSRGVSIATLKIEGLN